MKKQLFTARQGDIWIEEIKTLPKGLKKRKNTTILYGSQTGHSHFLKSGTVLEDKKGNIYLNVPRKSQVLHDSDHTPIEIPKGTYIITRQKEHLFGDLIRLVID